MAPRNKKTTMAKLAREHKLRERRIDKQARKDARKNAEPADPLLVDPFDDASEPEETGVGAAAAVASAATPGLEEGRRTPD